MAVWHPRALDDADWIAAFYDARRPAMRGTQSLGDEFLDALHATEANLDLMPLGWPLAIQPDTRRAIVAAPFGAYGVYYRVAPAGHAQIVAVVHTARDPRWIVNLVAG